MPEVPRDLEELLAASAAATAFKDEVRAYAAHGTASRIELRHPLPRVKVLRVLAQLLHAAPGLAIERVRIDAWAGCSDVRGSVDAVADGAAHAWDFVWDCRWRAEREGLLTAWGFPDQTRAAREWGWRCFARWDAREPVPAAPHAPR